MGRLQQAKTLMFGLVLILAICKVQGVERPTKEYTSVDDEVIDKKRDPKLSVFQVVKFSNSICAGSSRNGTCYTAAECSNIGGSKDGTCADGFGVCCIVILTTSGSSSVNNTYIYKASGTTYSAGDHKYSICPCSTNICRIRFDFNTFTIASPATAYGSRLTLGTAANYPLGAASTAGDCWIDTFFVNAPYGRSTPIICGVNSGQHLYVDTSDGECVDAHYGIGGGTSATRELDIRVSQFTCGDEMGGPPGCLQYHTSIQGKIRSFNFPDLTYTGTVGYNYVHLSRQHYKACVRKGSGKAYICYWPCTTIVGKSTAAAVGSPIIIQPSFGLSLSPAEAAQSGIGTSCTSDYVTIPAAVSSANAAILSSKTVVQAEATGVATRFCGRYFATANAAFNAQSICTLSVPFELGVDFNDDEFCTTIDDSQTCEWFSGTAKANQNLVGAGGILGFSLCYYQTDA